MKKIICLAVGLSALMLAFGQPPPPPIAPEQQRQLVAAAEWSSQEKLSLAKFNLNFPGGTPGELVKAVEKATGKPLNAIIPTEDADVQLPPLKMSHVDVAQLFQALEAASSRQVMVPVSGAGGAYTYQGTGYSFQTRSRNLSDDSIWYFHNEKVTMPKPPQKVCRFYSLAPFLDRGFTVDDITTAIQTGWRMAGVTPPPKLEYHKETKLLIAYGEPDQLSIIQQVLGSLPTSPITRDEINDMKSEIQRLTWNVGWLNNKEFPHGAPTGRPRNLLMWSPPQTLPPPHP